MQGKLQMIDFDWAKLAEVLVGSTAVGRDLSILVSAWETGGILVCGYIYLFCLFCLFCHQYCLYLYVCGQLGNIGVYLHIFPILSILPILSPILLIFSIVVFTLEILVCICFTYSVYFAYIANKINIGVHLGNRQDILSILSPIL